MNLALVTELAIRNLARNGRRTAITSAAVVAGVSVLIMGFGLVDGLDENVIRAQEDAVGAHLLLRPEGYPADGFSYPIEQSLPPSAELIAALEGDSRVVAWAPRLWFTGRLVAGADSVRVKGIGYDPVADAAVVPRDGWELVGAWPATPEEVVLGSGLAGLLQVAPGAVVTLETRTRPGALNALTYTVSGVVSAHSPAVDAFGVWMPLTTAEPLLLAEGARTHLALRLRRRSQADAVRGALAGRGWVGQTSLEEVADLLALNAFRRQALYLVVLILMLIAGTGIANTVIMATYERVREIGTLRAMGLSRPGIQALFLIEGAVMGLFAGLLGAAVGAAVVGWFSLRGIDLSGVVNSLGEVSMSTILYMHFSWGAVLFAVAFGCGVSLLASIWPALHASRMNPADAVRAD